MPAERFGCWSDKVMNDTNGWLMENGAPVETLWPSMGRPQNQLDVGPLEFQSAKSSHTSTLYRRKIKKAITALAQWYCCYFFCSIDLNQIGEWHGYGFWNTRNMEPWRIWASPLRLASFAFGISSPMGIQGHGLWSHHRNWIWMGRVTSSIKLLCTHATSGNPTMGCNETFWEHTEVKTWCLNHLGPRRENATTTSSHMVVVRQMSPVWVKLAGLGISKKCWMSLPCRKPLNYFLVSTTFTRSPANTEPWTEKILLYVCNLFAQCWSNPSNYHIPRFVTKRHQKNSAHRRAKGRNWNKYAGSAVCQHLGRKLLVPHGALHGPPAPSDSPLWAPEPTTKDDLVDMQTCKWKMQHKQCAVYICVYIYIYIMLQYSWTCIMIIDNYCYNLYLGSQKYAKFLYFQEKHGFFKQIPFLRFQSKQIPF